MFPLESEKIDGKENLLFLDEPDVHRSGDLQGRLMKVLKDLVGKGHISLLIATPSSALPGELADYVGSSRLHATTPNGVAFKPIGEASGKGLPVFGAHPLSNVFNQAPFCF